MLVVERVRGLLEQQGDETELAVGDRRSRRTDVAPVARGTEAVGDVDLRTRHQRGHDAEDRGLHVEQRRGGVEHVLVLEVRGAAPLDTERVDVGVGHDDALGPPGRARRVEHRQDVVEAGRCGDFGLLPQGNQLVPVDPAGTHVVGVCLPAVTDHDGLQARKGLQEGSDALQEVGAQDRQGGFGVRQDVREGLALPVGVDRDDGRTSECRSEPAQQELDAVGQHHHDALATGDPERGERPGDLHAGPVELPVGVRHPTDVEERVVRGVLRPPGEDLADDSVMKFDFLHSPSGSSSVFDQMVNMSPAR